MKRKVESHSITELHSTPPSAPPHPLPMMQSSLNPQFSLYCGELAHTFYFYLNLRYSSNKLHLTCSHPVASQPEEPQTKRLCLL